MVVEKGPGEKWSHQLFDLYSDAIQFQQTREQQLLSDRFVLEALEDFGMVPRGTTLRKRREPSRPAAVDWRQPAGDQRTRDDLPKVD